MELKNEAFHPDKSVIVTGGEQGQYFKGVIAAAELSDPSLKGQTVNIPTGLVKLTTGKMSSRDGNVITIDWIFDQFRQAIEARGAVATDATIAGALRYQFLKVKIGSDVIFDINDAVSITGNTGSYLQYAHARAKSIYVKLTTPKSSSCSQRTALWCAKWVNIATWWTLRRASLNRITFASIYLSSRKNSTAITSVTVLLVVSYRRIGQGWWLLMHGF